MKSQQDHYLGQRLDQQPRLEVSLVVVHLVRALFSVAPLLLVAFFRKLTRVQVFSTLTQARPSSPVVLLIFSQKGVPVVLLMQTKTAATTTINKMERSRHLSMQTARLRLSSKVLAFKLSNQVHTQKNSR